MFLSTEVFIAEKTDGRLEMLLTTPLKLKEIWGSKRRALFTLIYPIVLILNVLIFYLQNKIWLTQMGISAGIQPATLTLAILAAPLLAYSLGSLIGLLSFLVSDPAALQSITFLIVFAVGFGENYLISDLMKNANADLITWQLVGAYFGIALIAGVVTWFLSRKLDKDYVISHMA
jgi:ABC-type transport system involved in multi-copper enzyme maturation permease subunit